MSLEWEIAHNEQRLKVLLNRGMKNIKSPGVVQKIKRRLRTLYKMREVKI